MGDKNIIAFPNAMTRYSHLGWEDLVEIKKGLDKTWKEALSFRNSEVMQKTSQEMADINVLLNQKRKRRKMQK